MITDYIFEESGYYKIRKVIKSDDIEKAIKEYEEWVDTEFCTGYIDLESEDRDITKIIG